MIGIKTEQLHALFRAAVNRGAYNDVGEVTSFHVVDATPHMYISVGFKRKVVTRLDDEVEWARIFVPEFLFNQNVARALFGDEPSPYGKVWQRIEPGKGVEYAVQNGYVPLWQSHLQQAVISDDPIYYMHKAFFGHGPDVR